MTTVARFGLMAHPELGHDSVDTTAIYTVPGMRELEQAVERVASG